MEGIKSVEGKLLYFIHKLYKENTITTFQKNQLKGISLFIETSCSRRTTAYLRPTRPISRRGPS